MRGLIIQQPHLNNILNGLKDVEIRTLNTRIREHIGLCLKGYVYGFAKIIDSYPIPRTELLKPKWQKRHRATQFLQSGSYANRKVLWVWELGYIDKLTFPIPYPIKQGQQMWINF